MKYIFQGFLFLFFSVSALAEILTTQIHSLDKGKKGEKHLIYLTNGHTAFVDNSFKSLIEAVEESLRKGDTVQVKLDQKHNLLSIQTVIPERVEPETEMSSGEMITYNPSIISSAAAWTAFNGMRRDYQNESQCYNRAHIWTYEAFQRIALKSNKLFIFFTSRYVRRYNFKWWFHVTPMVYVGGSSQANWRALDRRYTTAPLTTRAWTNTFMLNDAFCPVVYSYSSYRNHQSTQDCYLIPSSMYYWQPRDLEYKERSGYIKTQYFDSETSHAYWEAF